MMLTVPLLLVLVTFGSIDAIPSSSGDSIKLLIFGGMPARIIDYPYLVSLQIRGGDHFCGGAILDKNIILTAAHCLGGNKRPEDIIVIAGITERNADGDIPSKQVLDSTTFVIHPDYIYIRKRGIIENDIALVRTSGDFKWTRNVQPRSIPTNWDYKEGSEVTIAGWGRTEEDKPAESLLKVDLLIANDSLCRNNFPNTYLPESTFCTYSKRKDSCDGDSGNPVVNENGDLIGLVSYGEVMRCGKGPSVNTKTTFYQSWVDNQLKSMNQESYEGRITPPNLEPLALSRFFESTVMVKNTVLELCGPTWKLWCKNTTCHCYTRLKSLLTWEEAAVQCGRYGGALASIHSNEENEFLGGYINTRYTQMWIGLNDKKKDREFTWQNGEKPNYFAWYNKEPYNAGGDEHCVVMLWFMGWNDIDCSFKFNSLCKVPISNYSSKCKQGWAFYDTSCYQINTHRLAWYEARQNCKNNGAELASILTAEENEFIHTLLNDIDDDNLWIGLTRLSSRTFQWVDSSTVHFTALDPLWEEQKNFGGDGNCVLIHKDSGTWDDYICDFKFPSLCKMSSN